MPVFTPFAKFQLSSYKTFATHTEQGDYLEFGSSRRWIPRIELRKFKVPVPLEKKMTYVLEHGFFKHEVQSFQSRGGWMRSQTTIEKEALIAWASSPKALIDVLQDTLDDTYDVHFLTPKQRRQEVLSPIVEELKTLEYLQDAKFAALCQCLEQARIEGRKVIIFSERLATCVYLEEALQATLPKLLVANAVQASDDKYELKDAELVNELILDFAPEANQDRIGDKIRTKQYDVFVTTDAYGVGVNLQDASVVISYDIAWTPDTIIQRAGRILRLWKEPRKVQLYIFVGAYQEHKEGRSKAIDVEKRMHRLTERSKKAEKFTEMPMIPETDSAEFASLASLSSVEFEEIGVLDVSDIEEFSGVSPFLRHITERNKNLEYADAIPDDITSAFAYRGKAHQLYLLLRYKDAYFWMLYDISRQQLHSIKEDALLDMIQCIQETPIADVNPDEIEQYAQDARQLWYKQNKIDDLETIERICALYLKPHSSDSGDFSDVLHTP